MKQVNLRIYRMILPLLLGLFLSVGTFAQGISVKGHVKDASGEPVIGANVFEVNNKTNGTVTDIDGNFTLTVSKGATLSVSYIGYVTQEVKAAPNLVIVLQDDSQMLDQVVVIGYGSAKKDDLTGSVTAIKPDEMNRGLVTNAQDMMSGKIAGVNVVTSGGTPGGGATIRIRGGASLNASNDPLIVIDGLPMDNSGVKGLSNPLSMVNPNDIESFTVLKDASATAIYGSRASNGVIIITTKKGSKNGKLRLSYNGNISVSTKKKSYDVMNGDEYREFVKSIYGEGSDEYNTLGNANTDWQKEVYRTAVSTDHDVTLMGNVHGQPFRASLGATVQNGIIKTSDFKRITASLNFSPSFFDESLKFNGNLKGMYAKSRFADGSVVGDAMAFDPTQPVRVAEDSPLYNDYMTSFGGYFQWLGKNEFKDPDWPLAPNSLSQKNPVSTLEMKDDRAIAKSLIGNLEADYKFPFLPELRAHVNGGMDLSTGRQTTDIDPRSNSNNYFGYWGTEKIDKYNLLFNSYLQYGKQLGVHDLDLMGGYEWQHFHRKGNSSGGGFYGEGNVDADKAGKPYNYNENEWAAESYLVSFFSRVNYTLLDRYMLTATFRADGSSKFSKDNRWGYFPSVALAWKINNEQFLKNANWLSDFKLRLGYGITGQQEGIGEYSYFNSYVRNKEHAFYPNMEGDGTTYRPEAYNADLTWEKTTTYNAGIDFSILNGRFTSALDFYHRKTTDLLQVVTVAPGSNFSNAVMSNVGALENTGVEFSIGGKVIHTKDWMWDVSYNVTYNKNKITELTTGDRPGYYIPVGGITVGTGNNVQAHSVGHPAFSYYVYQQVYDAEGRPIENQFVDRNGDGVISDADRYFYKKPVGDVLMGLSSKLIYKDWDFSFSLRASLNNYVYNNVQSGNCNLNKAAVYAPSGYFSNYVKRNTELGFQGIGNYYMSDLFVQNASFLKCDNITLGYSFDRLFGEKISGRLFTTAQNVFTITKYKGLDPEVSGGIDNNIYPRPFVFLVGLNLNF